MELIILLIICSIFILLGYLKRRSSTDSESFFIGIKDGGVIGTTFSITASWIGATSMITLATWVVKLGTGATWYLISPSIGLIMIGLIGTKKIREQKGVSLNDYFENKILRVVIVFFLAIIYTLILGAQLVGFAKIASVFNVQYTYGLLLGSLVVMLYVILGGFATVRDTDIIQFLLLFLTLIVFLFSVPIKLSTVNFYSLINPSKDISVPMLLLFLSLGLMMFVAQENHQRIKSAKDEKTAKISCILAGIIIFIYTLIITIIARSIGDVGTNPLLSSIPNLNFYSRVLISVGILAAALSTADTALNISSYSTAKLIKRNPKRRIISFSVILSVLVAMGVAHFIPSIPKIILICINLYVGVLLPLVMSVFLKYNIKTSNTVFIITIFSVIIAYIIKFSAPGVMGLAAGFITLIIVKGTKNGN